MVSRHFEILENAIVDERTWYSIEVDTFVSQWLKKTFTENKDYIWVFSLKGIWVDCSEEVTTLMVLRWK
jgi:hypothetical protein